MATTELTVPTLARVHAPTLAHVRARMQTLLDDPESRGSVAQIVEVDGAMAGAVLRGVHCPLYVYEDTSGGAMVRRAAERTSVAILRRITEAMPGYALGDDRDHVESACRHWAHDVAVAAACRALANDGGFDDASLAFVAGLLHDLAWRFAGTDTEAPEKVTDGLLRSYALQDEVVSAVRFHRAVQRGMPAESIAISGQPLPERTRRLLILLARADQLVSGLGYDDGQSSDYEPIDSDVPESRAIGQVREAIELELRHAAALLGLDDAEPHDFVRQLTNAEMRAIEGERGVPGVHVARTAGRVAEVHRKLMAARACNSVTGILERGLHAIRDGLGFGRVVLLDPDSTDATRMRARTVIDPSGLPLAGGLLGFEVPCSHGGALQRVVAAGDAVLIEDHETDGGALSRLAVDQMLAARLSAGAANFGVVVVDQFFSGRRLTDEDAALLGLLCDALGLVLQNAALDVQGETLRSLAEKDELTGINNRRNIVSILDREIRRADRFGHSLSVALLDVDFFKRWNDHHGHQVGDVVLKAVAQLIASCSRDVDAYGRYGGEEFLVVLPETALSHAVLYAERLRFTMETEGGEMFPQYQPQRLSVSIGVTEFVRGDDVDKLVQRADEAMYAAKNYGRNRVCVERKPEAAD